MSFQAYIDNIRAKTGKTPEQFRALAEGKGLLKPGVKATQITDWLKADFLSATATPWRLSRRSRTRAGLARKARRNPGNRRTL